MVLGIYNPVLSEWYWEEIYNPVFSEWYWEYITLCLVSGIGNI